MSRSIAYGAAISFWLVAAGVANSAPPTVVINDTPLTVAESMQNDATLTDIWFVDQDVGWAVGDRGTIWHTNDGGRTWVLQPSGVSCRLNSVCFINARHGWAAGGSFEPYTHASRAVLLATSDGGQTWRPLPVPNLPRISRIKFFDAKRGIAAGAGSAAEPSGVYVTDDGGQTWEPLPADGLGQWLAADFLDANNGAVAGPAGAFAALMRRRVVRSSSATELTRSYRAMQLAPPTGGWLVGEGGLVMTTRDLGASWQTPPGELPPLASEHFDFGAVAAIGSQVWIAGSPGTKVFHSSDAGETWQAFDTGSRVPIHAMRFVDVNTGWAVGDLGTILATTDGGCNWHVQRQGGARVAILTIVPRGGDVPLELLAKFGAEEGYLSAVEVVHPTGDPLAGARCNDAMTAAGATSAQSSWRFPRRARDERLTPEHLLAELNRANDGRGLGRLVDHVARQIRLWQPDIIVVPHVDDIHSDPLGSLVEHMTLRAVRVAADADAPSLAMDGGMSAWSVKRVFGVVRRGERGDVRIVAGEYAPRLGRSLADAAEPARELLFTAPTSPPDTTNLVWLNRPEDVPPGDTELFAGIRLAPGSEARRRLANLPEEDSMKLRQLAARRRQMRMLLSRSQSNAAWEAQITNLTEGLDRASAGELLFQLAEGYRASGRLDLAADSYSALARRFPEHPLLEPALCWLVRFYASSEVAHRLASGASDLRPSNDDSIQRSVQQTSAVADARPVVGLSRDDRLRRAAMLGQYLESARPALYAEPSVRFPLVVAQRQLGFPNPAKRYFLTLAGRPENDPWRRCGETEGWFANPEGLPPPKTLGHCRRTNDRPHLDGKLDEPLWQSADRLRLRGQATAESSDRSADVRLTYNGEFLYLGFTCPKSQSAAYFPDARPRPRDADLVGHDRVTLRLDVDRDYTTAFELAIDHRGWTHDACWGDSSWNPAWFVAAGGDEQTWTAEAAIPLAALASKSPAAKHVWALAVERQIPGQAAEPWSGDATTGDLPDKFGLLIFE